MNWTTIYIEGRSDFREDVRRKLKHSELNVMPGYTDSPDTCTYDLYWLDERISLREFKKAVSARLIWKHRLRFYTNLETFIESQHRADTERFTPEEEELIAGIRDRKLS